MEKVRMGFIGCGGFANGKHLPAQNRNPVAEMVALFITHQVVAVFFQCL